jgi:hypothetical protein
MSGSAWVPILVLLTVLGTDLWVLADAKAQSEANSPVVASIGRLVIDTPGAWFIGCLFLWIVFFPLYIIGRRPDA